MGRHVMTILGMVLEGNGQARYDDIGHGTGGEWAGTL